MKRNFHSMPEAAAIERFLESRGIRFDRLDDGGLYVAGDLDLSNLKGQKIPDLSDVVVNGYFSCSGNGLTTLKGMPRYVGENFYCSENELETLEGGPEHVGGYYFCDKNRLVSLKGAPAHVGGTFVCSHNPLETLEGGPRSTGEGFQCEDARLVSLRGAPLSVGKEFYCCKNPLESLEGAPLNFTRLDSDFGKFKCWDDVPPELRLSRETRARLTSEFQAALERDVEAATTLKAALRLGVPLRLRPRKQASEEVGP
jgi:hypothetical protein